MDSKVEIDGKRRQKRKRTRNLVKIFIQKLESQFFNCSKFPELKWLKELIDVDENDWVDLKEVYIHNGLTENEFNVDLVKKLLEESKFIEINSDLKRIRRISDETCITQNCTVYVDRIPDDADETFIREVFGRLGHILDVQMPKTIRTKMNKGYCFICFSDPTSVQKTIEVFNRPSKTVTTRRKSCHRRHSRCDPKKKPLLNNDVEQTLLNSDVENGPTDQPLSKKIKLSVPTADEVGNPTTSEATHVKRHRKRKINKTRRIRRRKNSVRHKPLGLTVYTYFEWKNLKIQYLNLQKKNFGELKQNLKLVSQQPIQNSRKEMLKKSDPKIKKKRGSEKLADKASSILKSSLSAPTEVTNL